MNVLLVTPWDTPCGIDGLTLAKLTARIRVLPNGCWEWTGTIGYWGYAQWAHKGRTYRAHRLAYRLLRGELPTDGRVPDHTCRRKCCVNPWHLEIVTSRINTLRGVGPIARNAKQTHCRRAGHPLSGDNLRIKEGKYGPLRACRACERELNRQLQARYRREGRAYA